MKASLILVAVALMGSAMAVRSLGEEEYQFLFRKYMAQYQKQYHRDEFFGRYNVFKDNVDFVKAHNQEGHSYTLAVNEFADMTNAEFKAKHLGYKMINNNYLRSLNSVKLNATNLATSVDWRAKNAVTPVKDQGQCGSCWAFSTTGSLEGLYAIKKGTLASFSEQQLVDCSGSYGNEGCNGGWMDQGFQYAMDKGLCSESSYPYTAQDGSCKTCTAVLPAGFVTKFTDVPANDEASLAAALNNQPVSVAIEADTSVFQFYSGGVLDDASCGTTLDHGVLAVGYNTDGAKPYYIVKNSWGSSWGAAGYINLVMNKNMCGISQAASYPSA